MPIRLNGSTSGYTEINNSAVGTNNTITLPGANPTTNGSFLLGATSGQLSFSTDPTLTSLNGGPLAGFRNRIINGGMVVDQRNNGSSISSGVNTITYGVDRWYVYALGAAVTLQRVGSSAARFESALRLTGAASNTFAMIGQRIEVSNSLDLANQLNGGGGYVSLSFAAATSASKTVTWRIFYADAANNFATKTEIGSGTQATTSSLTTYVASAFLLPAIATTGLSVEFSVDNLTSGTFDLTGVQLEPGPVATPFEQRPIGTELALCQRYYQAQYVHMQAPAAAAMLVPVYFSVPMRATPTATNLSLGTESNVISVTINPRNYLSAYFQFTASVANAFVLDRVDAYSAEL
jgi:hypothetical protein